MLPPPNRILVAMAPFKGTLRGVAACNAVAEGLRARWPDAIVDVFPLADGGGGTVDAVMGAGSGRPMVSRVLGPLAGQLVDAEWAIDSAGTTAVIEMAAASGLVLVPAGSRNPMRTTSFGTGEMLAGAIGAGCREILLGIGDSATVDGGLGAAQGAGVRFQCGDGRVEWKPPITGGDLEELGRTLAAIEIPDWLRAVRVEVLSDVDNPLLGPEGAAAVFGPQKGATPEMVRDLERGLAAVYSAIERLLGVEVIARPGAGAAGGLGAAAMGLFGATLVSGAERLLALGGFEARLAACDLLVTGEGRMDAQSLRGKATVRVARRAREHGIPTVALVGLDDGADEVRDALGLRAVKALRSRDAGLPPPEEAFRELRAAAMALADEL